MKKYLELVVFIFSINLNLISCSNEYEKDLEYVRSLNNDQLVALFEDMEFHWRRMDETPIDGLANFPENSRIPEIFPNLLSPLAVNPRKKVIFYRPSMDEDIRLYFIGLAKEEWPSEYQAIELHYYDSSYSPTSEVLWERRKRPIADTRINKVKK